MSIRSPQQSRHSSLHMSPAGQTAPSTPRPAMSPARSEVRHSYTAYAGELRSPPPLTNIRRQSNMMQSPVRIGSNSSDLFAEAAVGDLVEVPGNHLGIVMYAGSVDGRQGTFLGVDLIEPDTDKGRNDGCHNGVRYFTAKGPISGMFVPQGRCKVVDSHGRLGRSQETGRPGSRSSQVRPGSRLRSVSTRSFSGMSLAESPRLSAFENWGKGNGANAEAAAFQKVLNENARLSRELEENQTRLSDLTRANAVQAQEMEELMSTVSELEQLQGSRGQSVGVSREEAELRAFLDDRERKIEDLRKEAEERRNEFREVTEHQQATIDELKALHQAQLDALQEKHDDIEERLLSSAGEQFPKSSQQPEQLEALQTQLLELSDELDALVGQQERARQDIDIANSRIAELEIENNRLQEDLAKAHQTELDVPSTSTPIKTARRMASIEQLSDNHPQKRQTIAFLEHELETLRKTHMTTLATTSPAPDIVKLEQQLEEVNGIVATLRQEAHSRARDVATITELEVALAAEKEQRAAAEEQCHQLEETLERTILQQVNTNNKSPRASRPSLSISTASVSPELDLRSPRADRGLVTTDLPSEGAFYCEYCETDGHDIVSCKKVFGSNTATPAKHDTARQGDQDEDEVY